jgi:hypothetical protein
MNPAQYWIAAKKDSLQICIFVAMNWLQRFAMQ